MPTRESLPGHKKDLGEVWMIHQRSGNYQESLPGHKEGH